MKVGNNENKNLQFQKLPVQPTPNRRQLSLLKIAEVRRRKSHKVD